MTEAWLSFLAGLAGSPHCLGMCGGIVAALALAGRDATLRNRQFYQLLYNLGRVTTYTLLGFSAGWLGSTLNLLAMQAVAQWLFVAANLFVMIIGFISLLSTAHFSLFSLDCSKTAFLTRPVARLLASSSPFSPYLLGLTLGFLPCGLVYALLISAAGSGTSLRGGAIMAAVGFGTMPALLGFGSLSGFLTARLKQALFRVTGLCVALLGFAGLCRVLWRMGILP